MSSWTVSSWHWQVNSGVWMGEGSVVHTSGIDIEEAVCDLGGGWFGWLGAKEEVLIHGTHLAVLAELGV